MLWRKLDSCGQGSRGVGGVLVENVKVQISSHTYFARVCRLVAAVLAKGTTIIAWQGVWECCGESWIVVGRDQGVWGVCISGK